MEETERAGKHRYLTMKLNTLKGNERTFIIIFARTQFDMMGNVVNSNYYIYVSRENLFSLI